MKNICVFCGSSFGNSDIYRKEVQNLGAALTERKLNLIYGGGNSGLMGELARSFLEAKREVIGVIPTKIHESVEQLELTELFIVGDMHERKAKMYELGDAFIALPGGIGTLEELTETLTWQQLGYHEKPVGILNINSYYDQFLSFLEYSMKEGFLKEDLYQSIIVSDNPNDLLTKMDQYKPNLKNKWS